MWRAASTAGSSPGWWPTGRLPAGEAAEVARDLAYRLPKRAYRLDGPGTGSDAL